ncbi:MAG: hypothetical protein R6W82_11740 [bacterium]
MRPHRAGPLLALTLISLAACGGRDEVTVEEHLVLTLRHDARAVLPAGPDAELTLQVEGNVEPLPGSVRMWWYAEGDTGWTAVRARAGTGDLWTVPVPTGRRGERAAYFLQAAAPSRTQLYLPPDLEHSRRPYRTVRAGGYPGLLRVVILLVFGAGGGILAGAGFLALRSLQSRGDPLPAQQGRLARWTAAGTALLGLGALAGLISSMFIWGVPYRGFPLGGYVPHTKVLLLLLLWGGVSWASWGTLSRTAGSRDIFPPRVHSIVVLGALLLSVLIVLLPGGAPEMDLPPLPLAG